MVHRKSVAINDLVFSRLGIEVEIERLDIAVDVQVNVITANGVHGQRVRVIRLGEEFLDSDVNNSVYLDTLDNITYFEIGSFAVHGCYLEHDQPPDGRHSWTGKIILQSDQCRQVFVVRDVIVFSDARQEL